MGEKRKTGLVQQPHEGAEATATSVTARHPIHDRLGTCPNRDGFTVVNTKRGKKAKKTLKPTPQEEKEEVDKVLLERELKLEVPGEWRRVTEVPYGNYHPYLFETSSLTNTQLETCLFQAREFLQEFTRRKVDGDAGKEALEWAGCLLSVAHHKGVITDDEKAAMPLEGAYAIINWLLKCTQQANDNIVMPMQRSMKDALHCQDKEAQAVSGRVDKEKSQKERDHSYDSTRRQHYWEAWDQDSEPSDSEKEVAQAMSQVYIHSSTSESSMAPDTSEPKDGQGAEEEDMEISSQETMVLAGGSQDNDFRLTPTDPLKEMAW